jgi:hypothetical protein
MSEANVGFERPRLDAPHAGQPAQRHDRQDQRARSPMTNEAPIVTRAPAGNQQQAPRLIPSAAQEDPSVPGARSPGASQADQQDAEPKAVNASC